MKPLIIALATSACVVASATVSADSWPGSRPQVYTSANGSYRFKTRPPQLATWSGKSYGTLVSLAADGTETVRWSRELVNIPVIAFVADDARHLVTFDTWAKLGYEHALVIYDEQGAVVVDDDLEAAAVCGRNRLVRGAHRSARGAGCKEPPSRSTTVDRTS
jgi:hypothetical protein